MSLDYYNVTTETNIDNCIMKKKWTFLLPMAIFFSITLADSYAENTQQNEMLADLEVYLNNLKTLEAKFIQTDEVGTIKTGTLYIKRPGKLRIEYDPPEKFLIVADGYYLIFIDLELGSPSYQNLNNTPASFLLDDALSFSQTNINLVSSSKNSGIIEVELKQTDDNLGGKLKLIFSDKPIELRQWKVEDPQSGPITITLLNIKSNLPLKDNLFEYEEEDIFK